MSAVVCAEAGFPHIIIGLCTAYYNTCYIACYVIRADNICVYALAVSNIPGEALHTQNTDIHFIWCLDN